MHDLKTSTALYFALTVPITLLGVLYPWFNLVLACLILRGAQGGSYELFEAIKFILVVAGLIAYYFYPRVSVSLLQTNILVAVVQDLIGGNPFNALFGALLSLTSTMTPSLVWIILYSAWNSIFTIGYGFSVSTRLTLLTGLIVHLVTGLPWALARCVSLLTNMALRANQVTDVFTPGQTWVTD